MPGKYWLIGFVAIGALALIVALLAGAFPNTLASEDSWLDLTWRLLLIVLVGASLIPFLVRHPSLALRHGASWAGIFVVLILGYSFRTDAGALWNRFIGELVPSRGVSEGEGVVRFRAANDGHVHIEALINGKPLHLIVDTGATVVSLSRSDARRVGFDPDRLDYFMRVRTANGETRAAPVRIGEIRVGDIVVTDVRGSVSINERDISLLGMSFLDRVGSWSYQDGTLTLRR